MYRRPAGSRRRRAEAKEELSRTDDRRLRREPDSGWFTGVCAGLAEWLGVDPTLVRLAVVVLTVITGGLAALGYVVLWAAMPVDRPVAPTDGRGRPRRSRSRGRGDRAAETSGQGSSGSWAVGNGVGFMVLGLLFIFRETGIWWSDALVWPLVLITSGTALIWRQVRAGGDDEDETGPADAGGRRRPRLGPYRGGFGVALLLGGAVLFLYLSGALEAGGQVALAGLTAVIVIGLVLAPFWVRLLGRLSAERAERIRSQERAEVAAHLHDSVLQTLALIQKNAGDERQVSTLARSQERELREWLSGGGSGGDDADLAEALKAAAAEIEELHRVPIDAVIVGDRPLDERGGALVAAAREALVNAARHGGGTPVRLYAEIDVDGSQVFVHDRGPGFDPERIPAGRHGVRDSIIGRMERHGGRAVIRSVPGEGTEIELIMETR